MQFQNHSNSCLLYTSDAADEGLGVDLGGRRIIKKKKKKFFFFFFFIFFFFFKQKTAYEMLRSLVGSEMCIRDRTTGVAMATVTSDVAQLAGQGNNLGELHFAIQDGKAYLNYDAFANNLPPKMKEALIQKNLYFNVTQILQKLTEQNFQATTVRDFTVFMPLLSSNTKFQVRIAKDFVIDNKELTVKEDGNHKYSVNLTGEQWAKVMEYSRKTLLKNFKEYAKLAKGSDLTDQE